MEGRDTTEVDTTTKTMVDQLEVDTEIPTTIDLITRKDPDIKTSTSTEEDKSNILNLEEGMHNQEVVLLQGEITAVEKEV